MNAARGSLLMKRSAPSREGFYAICRQTMGNVNVTFYYDFELRWGYRNRK